LLINGITKTIDILAKKHLCSKVYRQVQVAYLVCIQSVAYSSGEFVSPSPKKPFLRVKYDFLGGGESLNNTG
jgi:hypothetical protein